MSPIPSEQVIRREATPVDIKSLPSFFSFLKRESLKHLTPFSALFCAFFVAFYIFTAIIITFFQPTLFLFICRVTSSNLMSASLKLFLLPRTPNFFYMHNNFPSFMMTVENAFTLLKRKRTSLSVTRWLSSSSFLLCLHQALFSSF